MRPLRLLAPSDPGHGFPVLYHITSRVVDKRFIFTGRERARFLKLAMDFAMFSGFELVSWCLMSNHFHLLVRVPVQDVEAISDEEMVERLRRILSPKRLNPLIARLESALTEDTRRAVLADFRKRIGHLPSYVKAVKQVFTQWFNAVNQREGTLWEGRYRSTLIEDTSGGNAGQVGVGEIARIVARYIDLNPVRAKVAEDPKDSEWTSYGAAARGDQTALRGLRLLWGDAPEHMARGQDARKSDGSNPEAPHLAVHRIWLRENAEADDSSATSVDEPGNETPKPRGRPRRLTGLSRERVLGSRSFTTRFDPSAVSSG